MSVFTDLWLPKVRDWRLDACHLASDEAIFQHADFFDSLDKGGLSIHSDDESDAEDENDDAVVLHSKVTSHVLPLWRSISLTKLLWFLDELARQSYIEKMQENDGVFVGNPLRKWLFVMDIGQSRRIPSELPINWYSKAFIRSLEGWELDLLRPAPPRPFGEGIHLVKPPMAEDVSMDSLEELLGKLADADLEDMDGSNMEVDK